MEIKHTLIDTNIYSAFKKGDESVKDLLLKMDRIYINPIVLGELHAGFKLGNKESQNVKELNEFLKISNVEVLNITENTAERFGEILKKLRRKGKPIPTNDIWIAANAIEFNLPIYTHDSHFQWIDNLVILAQ